MANLNTGEFASALLEHVACQFEAQYQRKSLYNKNCVLTGCIECYCLGCDAVLRSEADVDGHIETAGHKENFKKFAYVDAISSDCIRKINKRYYCEYCNKLLATMPKIRLHIKQQSHITNKSVGFDSEIKSTLYMSRVYGEVIAFDSLLINELSWNGIIDANCIICDDELDDIDAHKNDVCHVINMIQSKIVEVGAVNLIRQIDESMFQCLTCNILVASNEMKTHFDEPEHMILHTACQIAKHDFFEKIIDEDTLDIISEPESAENPAECKKIHDEIVPLESKDEAKEESINDKEPVCKNEVSIITKTDETIMEVEPHIDVETKKIQEQTLRLKQQNQEKQGSSKKRQKKGKIDKEEEVFALSPPPNVKYESEYERYLCEPFGLKNFIFTCRDESRTFCLLCDWNKYNIVDETLKNHMLGYHHRTLLEMENNRLLQMQIAPKAVPSKNAKKKEKKQQLKKTEVEHAENSQHEMKKEIRNLNTHITDVKIDKKVKSEDSSDIPYDNMKRDPEVTDTADANSSNEIVQVNLLEETEQSEIVSKFGDVTETVLVDTTKSIETLEDKFSQFNLDEDFKNRFGTKDDKAAGISQEQPIEAQETVLKESEISQKVLEFAEENLVAFNPDLKEFFCTVCGNKVSAVLRKMQRHVAKHEKVDERPSSPLQYQTMPFEEYVESIGCVESFNRHDTIINNEKCVNVLIFHMMKIQDGGIRCLVCNDLSIAQVTDHIHSDKHKSAVSNTPLLYTVQNEFVRELRDGVYHCGYCNIFESGFNKLEQHLKTNVHLTIKEKSEHSLVKYMFETEMEYENYKNISKKELGDFMSMMQILSENITYSQ